MYLGFVLKDSIGDKAKCWIAKRKLDMISGNVNSWARHLTSEANLESVREMYDLSAAMAKLEEDKTREKERWWIEKKKIEEAKKLESKKQKKEEEKSKRVIALPKNLSELSKGLDHVLQLTNPRLKEIIIYSYGVGITEVKKKKKEDLKQQIQARFRLQQESI